MTTLFAKVALLLTLSMLSGAFGAYLGRGIRSLGAFIGLAIAFIAGVFVVFACSGASPVVASLVLLGWVFISGLFIGPAIESYAEELGWETVAGAYLGTAGVMSICGLIGGLSGVDFSGMGFFLNIALFGLIIFGIVAIFVRMSREVSIVQSIIGMVVFAGYFIFDFFRLSKSVNTWQAAVQLTVNIYLDFVNFFLYLLQLLAASKKDSSLIPTHDTAVALLHHIGPSLSAMSHHVQTVLSAIGIA